MSTINFNQAVFQQQNHDEIQSVKDAFQEKFLGKAMRNTLFQFSHFDIINKGLELSEYIMNDDISQTTLKKLNEFLTELTDILESDEFNEGVVVAKEVSKIRSKK